MKVANWKKWLLGILAVILIYIWYDALQTMYPESTGIRVITPKGTQSVRQMDPEALQYSSPKVNPFKRPSTAPPQSNRPVPPQKPADVVTRLTADCTLKGVLGFASQSQAVVVQRDRSHVVSIGDSLAAWQLLQVNENSAVFGHDKLRDTLWLYTDD